MANESVISVDPGVSSEVKSEAKPEANLEGGFKIDGSDGYEVIHSKSPLFYDLYERKSDLKRQTHYCPGCGHGVVHKLIAEALQELGLQDKTIFVSPVGCSVFAYYYFDVGNVQVAHGRAPASATGVKRSCPDKVVISYQGDGDLAAIGTAEILHAANRGEKITVFFVNNGIYGMTGGQMAPTTPSGMVTTTTPHGRDVRSTGPPIDASKLVASLEGPAYVRRVFLPISPTSTEDVFNAKGALDGLRAVRHAFEVQERGGFAFVEFVSTCSVNWKVSVLDAKRYAATVLAPLFPAGVYRDRFHVEGP